MSNFTITYTLNPDQYADGASKVAVALKSEGKAKAVRVGITELVGGVLGLFFVKQSPILLLFVLISFAMGLYSLCFYPLIFPRSVRKKSYARFIKSPAAHNPITIIVGDDQLTSQVGEELRELDYSKLTAIKTSQELVLTSAEWSAVVPKQSLSDQQFTELTEALAAKPLAGNMAI